MRWLCDIKFDNPLQTYAFLLKNNKFVPGAIFLKQNLSHHVVLSEVSNTNALEEAAVIAVAYKRLF